jgi:2',3'-cyclic-nucleotide 2'-phosphodiesterase (5'-nucleotidase family)
LKPYVVKQIQDGRGGTIPVGIIGLTTAGAFTKEPMSFQAGSLTTDAPPEPNKNIPTDPMASALLEPANRYAKELQDQGIQTIIVVLHDGASHSGSFNNCVKPQGPAIDFAKYASPAIDVILAGHWHTALNCSINDPDGNPRPVIEGSNHGRLITEVNLAIDPVSKDVIRDKTVSVNHPVTRDVPADPEIGRMALYWIDRGKAKWAEPVAELAGDLTNVRNEHGESTLADVVADAFYAAGMTNTPQPADFALTKGVRKRDLLYGKGANPADRDGLLLFGELTEVDGTHDSEVVLTLTGLQIDQVLEEQWSKKPDGTIAFNPLNVSYNVRYTYDKSKPVGERVDPANVWIDGKSLDPGRSYRIATNGEIAASGGGYPSFLSYSNSKRVASWPVLEYMKSQGVIQLPKLDRVKSIGQ